MFINDFALGQMKEKFIASTKADDYVTDFDEILRLVLQEKSLEEESGDLSAGEQVSESQKFFFAGQDESESGLSDEGFSRDEQDGLRRDGQDSDIGSDVSDPSVSSQGSRRDEQRESVSTSPKHELSGESIDEQDHGQAKRRKMSSEVLQPSEGDGSSAKRAAARTNISGI